MARPRTARDPRPGRPGALPDARRCRMRYAQPVPPSAPAASCALTRITDRPPRRAECRRWAPVLPAPPTAPRAGCRFTRTTPKPPYIATPRRVEGHQRVPVPPSAHAAACTLIHIIDRPPRIGPSRRTGCPPAGVHDPGVPSRTAIRAPRSLCDHTHHLKAAMHRNAPPREMPPAGACAGGTHRRSPPAHAHIAKPARIGPPRRAGWSGHPRPYAAAREPCRPKSQPHGGDRPGHRSAAHAPRMASVPGGRPAAPSRNTPGIPR